ncbi:MAG: hypothetical protein ABSD13_04365 [Candidatus Korobacteraceae bacterium]|jgi:hypothetical protein
MISRFFSWGIFGVVLMVIALVHFVRRQPSFYWLYLIIFLGPLGALIYLAIEWLPELFDPGAFRFVERGRRGREVEAAIRQNPSAGNYEELGLLRLDKGDWSGARSCFDRALAQRTDSIDPFYRRGLAEVELGDYAAARADLEHVVTADAGYDFQRAAGLLALADWKTRDIDRAQRLFEQILRTSTLTETQLNYAEFLAETGHREEARQQSLRIRDKRAGMPGFQRRRERKLFRRNSALLRKL